MTWVRPHFCYEEHVLIMPVTYLETFKIKFQFLSSVGCLPQNPYHFTVIIFEGHLMLIPQDKKLTKLQGLQDMAVPK